MYLITWTDQTQPKSTTATGYGSARIQANDLSKYNHISNIQIWESKCAIL